MSKIIRLTESDLTRIVRRVINESGGGQPINSNLLQKLNTLASELDIDVDTIQDTAVCTIDEILPNQTLDSEGQTLLTKVKEKVMSLVNSKSISELKNAFKTLKKKLDSNGVNEVIGAMVPFTLLGITAPVSLWIAIGAILLIILIWAIIRLSSWIPKSSGHGCSKVIRKRVRVRR
jgi:hypothetical protein